MKLTISRFSFLWCNCVALKLATSRTVSNLKGARQQAMCIFHSNNNRHMLRLWRKIKWITSLRNYVTTNEMIISALGNRKKCCFDRIRTFLPSQCSFQVQRWKKETSVCTCLHPGLNFLSLYPFKDMITLKHWFVWSRSAV